jgi:hypothetical protein
MIKYQQSVILICTDPAFLNMIYQKAGRPGLPVHVDLLHWVPFKKNSRITDKTEK